MSKAEEREQKRAELQELKEHRHSAKLRHVMISAQKVRLIADLVRRKFAQDALDLLQCYPNRGARLIEKVLKSAMSNAEQKGVSDPQDLFIEEIRVDEGPMVRRWMPGSRGVSTIIRRKMSHIVVVLVDE